MMARCGRPELGLCPRGVGRGAPARKRRRLVLAPLKSARNPPPKTPDQTEPTSRSHEPTAPGSTSPATGTAKQPGQQRKPSRQKSAALPSPPRVARGGAIAKRPCRALSAVRSTCMRRISCGFWRVCYAKISGGFSDDGAPPQGGGGVRVQRSEVRHQPQTKSPNAVETVQPEISNIEPCPSFVCRAQHMAAP